MQSFTKAADRTGWQGPSDVHFSQALQGSILRAEPCSCMDSMCRAWQLVWLEKALQRYRLQHLAWLHAGCTVHWELVKRAVLTGRGSFGFRLDAAEVRNPPRLACRDTYDIETETLS
eukprot:1156953-Pelagomonas_calceolata.AAC.1